MAKRDLSDLDRLAIVAAEYAIAFEALKPEKERRSKRVVLAEVLQYADVRKSKLKYNEVLQRVEI